jgi:hypothetical protein
MCGRGVQTGRYSAAGTRPRPPLALCRPGPRCSRDAATHPPRPRWSATLSAPRDPSPSRPTMHPSNLVTGTCHVFPSWPDGNHARHHPSPPIMETYAGIFPPRRRDLPLPFRHPGFTVSVAARQRWLLFVCNLHDAFDDAVECTTSIAALMHARDCRQA